jgi:hypothetical protein
VQRIGRERARQCRQKRGPPIGSVVRVLLLLLLIILLIPRLLPCYGLRLRRCLWLRHGHGRRCERYGNGTAEKCGAAAVPVALIQHENGDDCVRGLEAGTQSRQQPCGTVESFQHTVRRDQQIARDTENDVVGRQVARRVQASQTVCRGRTNRQPGGEHTGGRQPFPKRTVEVGCTG